MKHDCELILTTPETRQPLFNLYPLYLQDLAGYREERPNVHGILTDDPDIKDWPQYMEGHRPWWNNPEYLFPYLILADGIPAGFHMIAGGPYAPNADLGIEWVVYEFFVAHAFRGTNVAAEGAKLGIDRHRGAWEVVTWPTAVRAQSFWRKTLPGCAKGEVAETQGEHPFGERVIWTFQNA